MEFRDKFNKAALEMNERMKQISKMDGDRRLRRQVLNAIQSQKTRLTSEFNQLMPGAGEQIPEEVVRDVPEQHDEDLRD
eukprot:CAMPEP_0170492464 /NCGR_PEP_ID=MMETSP0208-20121228/12304_1 /TAXON_ID=197538 /ORGANISM="Strombidium inclinatum, Strain S3" /LENGTH=78 /DNA_ID=CAMNT_0010768205 /DNA_START=135 /DNA_END=370 /DNA_ORIENTATION=+